MNLRLLQLGDSALPIGGYSHSWGLEAAIEHGQVRDAPALETWTRLYLREMLGPLEGVIVAAVARCPECAPLANRLLWASLSPPTLRHASRDMGEQLLSLAMTWEWGAIFCPAPSAPLPEGEGSQMQWHHAVVFGCLAAGTGATPRDAVALYLHQAALGVISAGVRGIPIGHTHGQQILAWIHSDIAELAEILYDKPLETAGSNCPAYEILCHEQSRLYTRIFRS
ncbi:MAG: urease accessory protein UreF [Gemmataceae bacterium]|nr:urease accessory protein UreF [Gemmataceae bacterium]